MTRERCFTAVDFILDTASRTHAHSIEASGRDRRRVGEAGHSGTVSLIGKKGKPLKEIRGSFNNNHLSGQCGNVEAENVRMESEAAVADENNGR